MFWCLRRRSHYCPHYNFHQETVVVNSPKRRIHARFEDRKVMVLLLALLSCQGKGGPIISQRSISES